VVGAELLVILDGASEPLHGERPTSLERARTPALDALARDGELARVRTVPEGLAAGSETAIPVLLGWTPAEPVDRASIEAAAHGIAVAPGQHAWRVDVRAPDGTRAGAAATREAARALAAAAPGYAVHRLAGHRLLLVGAAPAPRTAHAAHLRLWPEGAVLPRALGANSVVVAARGATCGIATLLGASVVVPPGATGDDTTDLHAKAGAAAAALDGGAARVVVHAAGADEAAHTLDAAAKVAFLERADRELVGPLAAAAARPGAVLRICSDHGCDPATGAHDAHPVPHLTWSGPAAGGSRTARRLTERDAAALDVLDLTTPLVPA